LYFLAFFAVLGEKIVKIRGVKPMQVRPYLIFKGECQPALDLYSRAFNTTATQVMRFADLPSSADTPMPISDSQKNWVVMAVLPFGESFLRLSDTIGELNEAQTGRINLIFEGSVDEVKRAFAVLAEEGRVTQPLVEAFFSPCYGMLYDKFGVDWVFSAVSEEY
jgi:PhnB protein